MPIAGPRFSLPRRSIHDTSGSSASARKSEIRSHEMTWRAIHSTSSAIATAIAIPSTRRTVRVRKSTTRSACTVPASRPCRTTPPLRCVSVRLLERRGWTSAAVLAAYVLVAFAYWGLRLLPHPGRYYVGTGTDPQIFVWSIGWWPHAIVDNLSAVHTHAIWAPQGQNLAWATSVPSVALAFAPLTWLTGPVVSYNVAAVLMPALAAWTAFLLCGHLTRSLWPSLCRRYLSPSSSSLLPTPTSHMHMTSVFLLPLIALVVIRYVQHEYDGLGLTLRLGPMVALQFGLSTENAFSYALALAIAVVLAFILVPTARRRLLHLIPPPPPPYPLTLL